MGVDDARATRRSRGGRARLGLLSARAGDEAGRRTSSGGDEARLGWLRREAERSRAWCA
jgi:hypothetical protein